MFLKDIKIDRKWWNSLPIQQQLTSGMALIIFILTGVLGVMFYMLINAPKDCESRIDRIREEKNAQIDRGRAKIEAINEQNILYLRIKEKNYYELLLNQQKINIEANENIGN